MGDLSTLGKCLCASVETYHQPPDLLNRTVRLSVYGHAPQRIQSRESRETRCYSLALVDSCCSPDALADEGGVRAVALFDHEEVGSDSAQVCQGLPHFLSTISLVYAAEVAALLWEVLSSGSIFRAACNQFDIVVLPCMHDCMLHSRSIPLTQKRITSSVIRDASLHGCECCKDDHADHQTQNISCFHVRHEGAAFKACND
eukprot:scaffold117598_cov18-Tisochrysis_lutea.AAC.1